MLMGGRSSVYYFDSLETSLLSGSLDAAGRRVALRICRSCINVQCTRGDSWAGLAEGAFLYKHVLGTVVSVGTWGTSVGIWGHVHRPDVLSSSSQSRIPFGFAC